MKNRLLNKIEEYKKLKFKIDKFIIIYFPNFLELYKNFLLCNFNIYYILL